MWIVSGLLNSSCHIVFVVCHPGAAAGPSEDQPQLLLTEENGERAERTSYLGIGQGNNRESKERLWVRFIKLLRDRHGVELQGNGREMIRFKFRIEDVTRVVRQASENHRSHILVKEKEQSQAKARKRRMITDDSFNSRKKRRCAMLQRQKGNVWKRQVE